jgi:hypothetical protein
MEKADLSDWTKGKEKPARPRGNYLREADSVPLWTTVFPVEVLVEDAEERETATDRQVPFVLAEASASSHSCSPLISSIERPISTSAFTLAHHLHQAIERPLAGLEDHHARVEAVGPSGVGRCGKAEGRSGRSR